MPCIVHQVKSRLVYTLKDLDGRVLGDFHVKDLKIDDSYRSDDSDSSVSLDD